MLSSFTIPQILSQTVAKTASESMYKEEKAKVKSKLVDSYAWDTTCKWLTKFHDATFALLTGILPEAEFL